MSKAKNAMPSPDKKPEIYDSYDLRSGDPVRSKDYYDSVLSEGMKADLAKRKAMRAARGR